ncbi:MAG: hypothetical protein H8E35_14875 [Ardenticatenia bacterium]|nr:hypothetical protein [Ardenticatenia bacterium]
MKSEKPELAAQFVRIARKGRALGLCLILAMQKPSGIVDGQIEANTRFRLCLRVASTEDSQAMLHRPDAAFLTGVGRSYLQVGANEVFDLFQVAWSGDRYDPEGITASDPDEIVEVALDGSRQVLFRPSRPESQPLPDIKQLDAVVAHLADTAQTLDIAPLEKLWLDPLPDHLALQDLPRAGGWNGATWEAVDGLVAPVVGRLDDPLSKTQDPLRLDLGRRGHLLLYGAPGTGKTTFVQTLITSLAMSYSPDDVHIYIMDFGGKMLKMYEGAVPHVGGVVVADETERIDRLFQFLREEVADRRARFGAARAATLDSYRRLTGESLPAIVVVLDNYANFQTAYQNDDDKLDAILHLARDGGSCGIHLVMTTNEITSVRLSVSSNVNLRLTLNLADTSDYSAIVGRTHGLAPEPLPGRGLIAGSERPLEYQVALPAPGETDADRIAYLHDLFQVMREAWRGDWARQIRVLPAELSLADLLHPTGRWHVAEIAAAASTAVPLGLKVADLKPLIVDLATSSLFLITGMIHSGKTSLLHSWLFSLAAHNSPENLHFFIVDSKRGGLWPLREELKHVKLYADNPADAENLFRSILSEVDARQQWLDERRRNRLPVAAPPGPRLVIAIDDLLHKHNDSTGGWLQASEGAANDFGSPTASRLLTLGNDLGVHLLVVTPFDGDWFSAVGKALTAYQTGIQLGTTSDTVFNVPGGVNPHLLPPGDGFWCLRGKAVKARFAHLDTDREQMPQPDVSTDSSS